MPKPFWFPLYANDFLASRKVALLTTEEIGAYILLLCHAWQDPQCSLPDDDEALAKLGRIQGDMTNLRACFRVKKHQLVNDRLYTEWEKVKEKSELAKHSVSIRWNGKRNTNVLRTKYSSQLHSQSESQIQKEEEKEKKELCVLSDFESFWKSYPKKVGKKEALKAWEKAKDKPIISDLIHAIDNAKHSPQWTKENGQFIPNPSTWLNQGRWADEPPQNKPSVFGQFLTRKDGNA